MLSKSSIHKDIHQLIVFLSNLFKSYRVPNENKNNSELSENEPSNHDSISKDSKFDLYYSLSVGIEMVIN